MTAWRCVLCASYALTVVSPAQASWRARPNAPEARTEVSAVALGDSVAVVGGMDAAGNASRRVDLYGAATRRWTRLPNLPVGLHHTMAVADGGALYVVGGYAAGGALTRPSSGLFILRPGGGWRGLRQMPEVRAAGGAAILKGRLYVVGGTTAGGQLATSTLVFDLGTRRWLRGAGLSTPREHLGVAARSGRVYALGGRSGSVNYALADAWDPREGRWTVLPDMPTARGGTSATSARGRVVSVGGEGPAGTNREVEAYDPTSRRWRSLDPLPEGRHGVGVAAPAGTLHVLLGGPQPGLTVSRSVFALTP